MKVLGLGLSRTGTSSLRQALVDLRYEDCYHYASLYQQNPRDAEMWVQAFEAKFEGKDRPFARAEWDCLLGHCMAVTDTPCAAFYKELLAAYPDAKVILTLRDSPQQWYASQMATIMSFFDHVARPTPSLFTRFLNLFTPGPTSAVARLNQLLLKHYMYKDLPERGIQFYEEYREEIERIVPRERLLVMNVKEGWGPLCAFLGVEVPGYAFPRVNDTREFHENVGESVRLAGVVARERMWKTAAVVVGVVGVLVVGILKLRSAGL